MASTTNLINISGRVLLFVTSVISLGIEGHLRASRYDTARVNLGVASSTIGLALSVLAAAPLLYFGSTINLAILLAFDFINFVLFLSASASLTQQRHICHEPLRGKCGEYRAGIAFLYMDWIWLLFLLVLEVYQVISGSTGGLGGFGGSGSYGSYRNNRAPLGVQPGLGRPAPQQPVAQEDLSKTEGGYADNV